MIKKYLHTRFRVSDMGQSLQFYRDILGMEVLEKKPPRAVQRWSSCVFPVQTVNWSCVHFLVLEKLKSPKTWCISPLK